MKSFNRFRTCTGSQEAAERVTNFFFFLTRQVKLKVKEYLFFFVNSFKLTIDFEKKKEYLDSVLKLKFSDWKKLLKNKRTKNIENKLSPTSPRVQYLRIGK